MYNFFFRAAGPCPKVVRKFRTGYYFLKALSHWLILSSGSGSPMHRDGAWALWQHTVGWFQIPAYCLFLSADIIRVLHICLVVRLQCT